MVSRTVAWMSEMEIEGVDSQRDIGNLWSQHACLVVVMAAVGLPVVVGNVRCGYVGVGNIVQCLWTGQ